MEGLFLDISQNRWWKKFIRIFPGTFVRNLSVPHFPSWFPFCSSVESSGKGHHKNYKWLRAGESSGAPRRRPAACFKGWAGASAWFLRQEWVLHTVRAVQIPTNSQNSALQKHTILPLMIKSVKKIRLVPLSRLSSLTYAYHFQHNRLPLPLAPLMPFLYQPPSKPTIFHYIAQKALPKHRNVKTTAFLVPKQLVGLPRKDLKLVHLAFRNFLFLHP